MTIEQTYLGQLFALLAGDNKVGVLVVNIQHDRWCVQLNGRGLCNCDPDIQLVPVMSDDRDAEDIHDPPR